MLERTDAITNEVREPITFVLAYPTVTALWTNCMQYLKGTFPIDYIKSRRPVW